MKKSFMLAVLITPLFTSGSLAIVKTASPARSEQVSAITGKIVRVEHENKKQEAGEKRKEGKEKKH